jgi:hypothetical protein
MRRLADDTGEPMLGTSTFTNTLSVVKYTLPKPVRALVDGEGADSEVAFGFWNTLSVAMPTVSEKATWPRISPVHNR